MQDINRDMGKHDAQIDHLERDVSELRTDVRAIREILDKADGSWRALMWVGGASSVLGALVSWFATKLHITQ